MTDESLSDIAKLLAERLAVLLPLHLEIEDESKHHIGHSGALAGGHYRVTVVSDAFTGKTTTARHRLVYETVIDLMRSHVHALAIRAKAPDEV